MPQRRVIKRPPTPRKLLILPTILEKEVARAPSWPDVTRAIRRFCNVPDVSTKAGLKECHKKFLYISAILNEAFDEPASSIRLRAGVIGIWGELVFDSILSHKLCTIGTIARLASSLRNEETCLIALQTLSIMTRSADDDIRRSIAKEATPGIIAALRTNSEEVEVIGTALTVLVNTVDNVYLNRPPAKCHGLSIDVDDLLEAIREGLAEATPRNTRFAAGHRLISSAIINDHLSLNKHQLSLDFVVASLRVPKMAIRLGSLSTIQAYCKRHKPVVSKRMQAHFLFDVQIQQGAIQKDEVLKNKEDFETSLGLEQANNFTELGLKLRSLALSTQHSTFDHQESPQGDDMALVPHRDRGGAPADNTLPNRDLADMIEIAYYLRQQMLDQVQEKADMAMTRSQHAFWYYARAKATEEDLEAALEWAEAGLNCKDTAPALRLELLSLVASTAINAAVDGIHWGKSDCDCWKKWEGFLYSAAEASSAFLKESLVDSEKSREMCFIALITTIVEKGDDLSLDMVELKELQEKLEQLENNDDLLQDAEPTIWGNVYRTIIERYKESAKLWDPRLEVSFCKACEAANQDHHHKEPPIGLKERFTMDDESDDDHYSTLCAPVISGREVELSKCDYCENKSAGLKRCGRCGVARYCNERCQKDDWKWHKRECIAVPFV